MTPAWSIPPWLTILGFVISWLSFGTVLYRLTREQKKDRREDEQYLQDLIKRVCTEFTNSDAYLLRRDRAMISIAQSVTEEAFRERARSFIDSGVYLANRASDNARIERLENTMMTLRSDLRKDFEEAGEKIAARVLSGK